ncbi:BQ2448_5931 [Microbotryum intermedium]|uniref:BQ2448_5931 protein n=1 Tax=Microbotryum intermedium TaxID=269621 RepID=A0A238F2Q3_9BASI|nr:BQ2448_5931 [Microbotryum intermedium]
MAPLSVTSLGHQVLFRAPHHPWPTFHTVDDQVRGGSSTSSVKLEKIPHSHTVAVFSGVLDITTLRGAGFASQVMIFPEDKPLSLPRSNYSGLLLTILRPSDTSSATNSSSESSTKAETTTATTKTPARPTSFVLNLKSSPAIIGPGGKRLAGISYEYQFTTDDFNGKEKQIQMKWDQFVPTYRGRAVKEPPLDPTKLYELSFMCRSNFGQQAGDFELKILELAALGNKNHKRQAQGCLGWAKQLVTRRYEALAGWYKGDRGVRLL